MADKKNGGKKTAAGIGVFIASKPVAILGIILFAVAACLLIFFGLKDYFDFKANSASYETTAGRIVSYKNYREWDEEENEYRNMYEEVVRYTVNGKEYEIQAGYRTNAPRSIGTELTVWYQRSNPGSALLDTGPQWLLLLLGAFFLFGASIIFIALKWKESPLMYPIITFACAGFFLAAGIATVLVTCLAVGFQSSAPYFAVAFGSIFAVVGYVLFVCGAKMVCKRKAEKEEQPEV